MDETYSVELYRQEGVEFRSVRLKVKLDGSVLLDAQDMGKTVKEIWGDDDYEFWVDVPATALRKLVFALLRDRYADRPGAVDEFNSSVKKKGSTISGIIGFERARVTLAGRLPVSSLYAYKLYVAGADLLCEFAGSMKAHRCGIGLNSPSRNKDQ